MPAALKHLGLYGRCDLATPRTESMRVATLKDV